MIARKSSIVKQGRSLTKSPPRGYGAGPRENSPLACMGQLCSDEAGVIVLDQLLACLLYSLRIEEVEQVFSRAPHYRFIETGDVAGEDLYAALGQTEAGRYLIVYFLHKATGEALVISAREMTKKERKIYAKAKEA
jgi:uncharacterized DUF497 family protein